MHGSLSAYQAELNRMVSLRMSFNDLKFEYQKLPCKEGSEEGWTLLNASVKEIGIYARLLRPQRGYQ